MEVLFGLLGATGVIVGIEETMEKRFEDAQALFDSLPAEQQQLYIDWLAAGRFVTSDTGHNVFYPDMDLDTSFYSDLWSAVTGSVSSSVSYCAPVDGYSAVDLKNSPLTGLSLGSCADSPFVVYNAGVLDSTCIMALLPSGYVLYSSVSDSGAVLFSYFFPCPLSTQLVVNNMQWSGTGFGGAVNKIDFSLGTSPAVYGTSVSGSSLKCSTSSVAFCSVAGASAEYSGCGLAWGNSSGRYIYGEPLFSTLSFYDGVIAGTDELLPCDAWVSKWDDAKTENRQVGIIIGQDLSGYNTLEDIYNPETGLVTGLNVSDVPVVPDVPITGDLTGIVGGVQSILDWLNGFIDSFIAALGDLLTALFVPSGTAFNEFFDPIMLGLKDKMDLNTFEDFKNRMQTLSSPPAPNVTMDRDGVTYTVIDFTSFNDVRDKLWGWLRGYLFVFILLYNMNFIYKLIRGQSMFDGMGTTLIFGWSDPGSRGSGGSGGSGGREKGGRGH